jgi:sporulation integral membrane protein YlbJ
LAVMLMPEVSFAASLEGLRVWWEIVFPALLPFFILCDVLMGLGVVHYIGALLEPLMRPLFGVPGVGAFAFAMGLASGYPIGARITARLRREGMCSRVEAERLVSFTNTADPLFMVGAVAVGMFRMPSLGATLAASHYISAVIVGLLLKFYGHRDPESSSAEAGRRSREPLLARAAHALYTARHQDGRSFGQIFGDSVRDSVATLLLIGGCIMLFSVVVRVLDVAGVTHLAATAVRWVLSPLKMSTAIIPSLMSGTFEITLGTEIASRAAAPLSQRAIAASAIIAWSGLSVFAQVAAMLHGTDVRMKPYLSARLLHAALAAAVTKALLILSPAILGASALPEGVLAFQPGFMWNMARSLASAAVVMGLLGLAAVGTATVAHPRPTQHRRR